MKPTISKCIYWHGGSRLSRKGTMFAEVHILVGYNDGSLADFQKMANELRKTFPQAKDSQISPGKTESSRFGLSGLSIVAWRGFIPRGKYPGWVQYENARCEYCW